MSPLQFKLTLKKIYEEEPVKTISNWKVKNIHSGRKLKTCENCGKTIPIGDSSTTFSRRIVLENNREVWNTYYAHTGPCTVKLAAKLKAKI